MESVANKVDANITSDRASKKSGKEDKARRKDDKSVDQVMKALNNMESTEEKLSVMCKKYAEVIDENRKLQLAAKQWEKGVTSLQREKEQIQADHSKAILTRSRLESLCRELQRQNKAVKEESLLKVREEEEKRKEVSAKFNATLAEITTLMSSSNEKTNKLRDENVDITKKFKSICEQSGLQQQQVDKMNMQRKLEAELSEAKMTKQKLEFSAEKEILLRDKQQLLMDLQEARTRCSDLMANEMNLKTQVALYADRYEEFQNALSRSNEVFGGFKGEMDKMSKKIVKLEKETLSWKSRWEKSHQALLEMASDKQQRDAELALVTRQLNQLQKLCRTLQVERVGLLAQIKSSGDSDAVDKTQQKTAKKKLKEAAIPSDENLTSDQTNGDLKSVDVEIETSEMIQKCNDLVDLIAASVAEVDNHVDKSTKQDLNLDVQKKTIGSELKHKRPQKTQGIDAASLEPALNSNEPLIEATLSETPCVNIPLPLEVVPCPVVPVPVPALPQALSTDPALGTVVPIKLPTTPDCKVPGVLIAPDCKVPEVLIVPDCKIPEVLIMPDCKVPGAIIAPDCKLPGVLIAPDCKVPEVLTAPDCKVPEVLTAPDCKVPEVLTLPDCKLVPTEVKKGKEGAKKRKK